MGDFKKIFGLIYAGKAERAAMLGNATILKPDHDCHQSPEDGCVFCDRWAGMTDKEKEEIIEEKIRFEQQEQSGAT